MLRSLACALVPLLVASAAAAFEYAVDPGATLELESLVAGERPAHRLAFDITAGELETRRALITYPDAFGFAGFRALGPPGTEVGRFELDFNGDGASERSVAILSLGDRSAFADLTRDGRFARSFEPRLDLESHLRFELLLPAGGDADPSNVVAPADTRVVVSLAAGLLENPPAGEYVIDAELTSVDPDSGDRDDGEDESPQHVRLELPLSIEPGAPSEVAFAELLVDFARLGDRPGANPVILRGRFTLGPESDGIRPDTEPVVFDLGDVALQAVGFSRIPGGWRRVGPTSSVFIRDNGSFSARFSRVEFAPHDPGTPVPFTLRIGDDIGDTEISLGNHGTFQRRGGRP